MPQQRHKSDNSPFNNPPYQRRQNSILLADEQSEFHTGCGARGFRRPDHEY